MSSSIPQKRCTKCGEVKPLDAFAKAHWTKDGHYPSCKACKGAYSRKFRQENPDLMRERWQRYKDASPDLVRQNARESQARRKDKHNAYNREHYAQNRDRVLVRTARYRREHPEVQRRAKAKWIANNREQHLTETRERSRRWRRENPAKSSAAAKRRMLRLKGAEGSHTIAEWEALKARYDRRCLRCGRQEPEIVLTEDHVIPITKGGSDYISNIQPLCGPCNSSKRARTIDYR